MSIEHRLDYAVGGIDFNKRVIDNLRNQIKDKDNQYSELLDAVNELFNAKHADGAGKLGHIYKPPTREYEQRVALAYRNLQTIIDQAK